MDVEKSSRAASAFRGSCIAALKTLVLTFSPLVLYIFVIAFFGIAEFRAFVGLCLGACLIRLVVRRINQRDDSRDPYYTRRPPTSAD
jgi:hypothetical protein